MPGPIWPCIPEPIWPRIPIPCHSAGAVTGRLRQSPAADEQGGGGDAAEHQNFLLHLNLQCLCNRQVRCLCALDKSDFTEVFQGSVFL